MVADPELPETDSRESKRYYLEDTLVRRLVTGLLRLVFRSSGDEWAIQHAHLVLERGLVLGIFPEGKHSRGRGLRAAKSGSARFALNAGVPILPPAIVGTDQVFRQFPKRTKVTLTIGEPIIPQPDESPLELTDRLMFTLAEMLPTSLRGVYAEKPPGF